MPKVVPEGAEPIEGEGAAPNPAKEEAEAAWTTVMKGFGKAVRAKRQWGPYAGQPDKVAQPDKEPDKDL